MKVVIAGGAGSLGRRVADDLAARGHEVVILTRSPADLEHRQVEWDGRTVGAWAAELEGSVRRQPRRRARRPPTDRANVELLRRSRVEPTRALVAAASGLATPPRCGSR